MDKSSNGSLMGLSAFQIKLLACFFMLLDHIGYFFFPEQIFLRAVGRLSFPLFAFMIANGWHFTHSRQKYFWRILIFGIIIQIPFAAFINSSLYNIFFTLSLGIIAIWLWDRYKNTFLRIILCLLPMIAAALLNADYGWFGVALILICHIFYDDFPRLSIAFVLASLMRILIGYAQWMLGGEFPAIISLQPFALLSLAFIFLYDRTPGKKSRWLFFIFYPGHLAILYLVYSFLK